MENLQYISIIIEAIIAVLGILIIRKGKSYGWGILVTFAIYVLYDLSKLISLTISSDLLYLLFFIATISMLWAVWKIYKEKKK